MKKLIAGNWKMNNTLAGSVALAQAVSEGAGAFSAACDFAVFPPFVHIPAVKDVLNSGVTLGAQDCSAYENGAYTGEVSAAMLAEIGCRAVILGHSERRQFCMETDTAISKKGAQAHAQGLTAIICVGETEGQRAQGREKDVIAGQLEGSLPSCCATAENTVIAYEPVWAIGTGKTATSEDIAAMHGFIREKLAEKLDGAENLRILYGGSVKPANAGEILALPNVDGALIGGASLKAEDFLGIAEAAKG